MNKTKTVHLRLSENSKARTKVADMSMARNPRWKAYALMLEDATKSKTKEEMCRKMERIRLRMVSDEIEYSTPSLLIHSFPSYVKEYVSIERMLLITLSSIIVFILASNTGHSLIAAISVFLILTSLALLVYLSHGAYVNRIRREESR